MMIGDGYKRLIKRMVIVLDSGSLKAKEAIFLQTILGKIETYRETAFVSDGQASWLYTILTTFEQGAPKGPHARNCKSKSSPSQRSSSNPTAEAVERMKAPTGLDNVIWPQEEEPTFDLSKAFQVDGEP